MTALHRLKIFLGLVFILTSVQQGIAADHHVTDCDQFQIALSAAASNSDNDTIYLAPGIYKCAATCFPVNDYAITITTEPGTNPGQVILDGNSRTNQVLRISATGHAPDITIKNIVVQASTGSASYFGALYISTGGKVTLENCTITECAYMGLYIYGGTEISLKNNNFTANTSPQHGGGLYINQCTTVTLENNYISGNQANNPGSGVYIANCTNVTVNANTITKNTGTSGLYIDRTSYHGGAFVVTDNDISYNTANSSNNGGGLNINCHGYQIPVTVTGNTISNNSGASAGGLQIYEAVRDTNISDNRITDNTAASYDYGGFLLYHSSAGTGTVLCHNNIITGNLAKRNYGGGYLSCEKVTIIATNNIIAHNTTQGIPSGDTYVGGLAAYAPSLYLINNTVYGNSVVGYGGGVTIWSTTNHEAYLYNNTIWGNTATTDGDDIYLSNAGLVREAKNNNFHKKYGTWTTAENNIDVDPLFVDPARRDYHLGTGSLCLDAGGDYSASHMPDKDLDGNNRPDGATAVDIGAYEHSTSEYHPADTSDPRWTLSQAEFDAYAADWKSGAQPHPIDFVTRAGYLLKSNSGVYKNVGGGKPLCWVPGP
ncbi:MAG: right-handed parallel beta-helix repeat-containing protein [Pseudomonadota bacterium]